MRNIPKIAALTRALQLLEAVIADAGNNSLSAIARKLGVPVATAHRQAATLIAAGYLHSPSHGRYFAGPKLLKLSQLPDRKQIVTSIAAPILDRLASRTEAIVHLGTLENDMVTYQAKTGRGSKHLFTRVGMQLEAYCSGIGKVLLAHLDARAQAEYLAAGPFVALTERTITDPVELKRALDEVARNGFAIDDGEIDDRLICVAVPIHLPGNEVEAAISVTRDRSGSSGRDATMAILEKLQDAAREIEDQLMR